MVGSDSVACKWRRKTTTHSGREKPSSWADVSLKPAAVAVGSLMRAPVGDLYTFNGFMRAIAARTRSVRVRRGLSEKPGRGGIVCGEKVCGMAWFREEGLLEMEGEARDL